MDSCDFLVQIFYSCSLTLGQSLDYSIQFILINPTVHLSHIPQYTTLEQKCAYFCSNVGYRAGVLWDLWDGPIMDKVILKDTIKIHWPLKSTDTQTQQCMNVMHNSLGWTAHNMYNDTTNYCQTSNISAPNPKTQMFLVPSCSCLCPIHWTQVLSQEWRCSWSSADRRSSNYIWVISKFIAY